MFRRRLPSILFLLFLAVDYSTCVYNPTSALDKDPKLQELKKKIADLKVEFERNKGLLERLVYAENRDETKIESLKTEVEKLKTEIRKLEKQVSGRRKEMKHVGRMQKYKHYRDRYEKQAGAEKTSEEEE